MCATLADWYDVVNLCGWLSAVDAGLVVAVHDVLSDALPTWWVLLVACAVDPGWASVLFAVGFWSGYDFWAALFIADACGHRQTSVCLLAVELGAGLAVAVLELTALAAFSGCLYWSV